MCVCVSVLLVSEREFTHSIKIVLCDFGRFLVKQVMWRVLCGGGVEDGDHRSTGANEEIFKLKR